MSNHHVALSHHFESFAREQVKLGHYHSVSDVVGAGLRLLEEHEQSNALKLEALKLSIAAGIEGGAVHNSDQVFERLQEKYRLQKASNT